MEITQFNFLDNTLYLHPWKGIYWEEEATLMLADLHLGKAAHFRKAGIPVPTAVQNANWDRLIGLIFDFKPKKVLFLGDLFHSNYNPVWEDLTNLFQQFEQIEFELVRGNHDVLKRDNYQQENLILYEQTLLRPPFLFSHHPLESDQLTGAYNLAGHIHPCVRLQGNARQRLRLPCFYFGEKQGILPAFGEFTGMATIQPKLNDQVFVIVDDCVVGVH